jgi:hypothetical protein
MKKYAILTFDYEVFLGRHTGTLENSVIKPTESVLKILKENNAKAIFFVDTTWLLFLQKNFSEDFLLVTRQLKNIVESGSSVELHLHPHWRNASVYDNRIIFGSLENYKLHSLSNNEIQELFTKSIDLLLSITNQKVQCFRAGGWCIEPFIKLKDAFEEFDIKYDFSVVPGTYLNEGKVYDYDFTHIPSLPFYKFQNKINEPDEKGCFIEFPLSTYQNYPFYRIINKVILFFRKDKIFGDGIGIKEKSIHKTLSQAIRFSKGMLTLDKTSSLVFKFLLKTHFLKSHLIIIVSHPKTLSAQALSNLLYIVKNYTTHNSSDLDKLLTNE